MDVQGDPLARYFQTYLEIEPIQEPALAATDPQIATIVLLLIERIKHLGRGGVILDIGCGKGPLLARLIEIPEFVRDLDWLYAGIDSDEKTESIQTMARRASMNRRVELVDLDSFYKTWPNLGAPQIVFCRNVLHELNIKQTTQLIAHIANNTKSVDTLIIQDLMKLPQGERHNACWFPDELEACIQKHGFSTTTCLSQLSNSGNRWFNLIAENRGSNTAHFSYKDSLSIVLESRQRQWNAWSSIEERATEPSGKLLIDTIDLDLQLAALTRQLRNENALAATPLESGVERRVRHSLIATAVHAFVQRGKLEKRPTTEKVRLRERGDILNILEEFLRGRDHLSFVTGGAGIGKSTVVEHLLANRSYSKTPIIIDCQQNSDIWNILEQIFAQAGLRLEPELLSVLSNLSWSQSHWPKVRGG